MNKREASLKQQKASRVIQIHPSLRCNLTCHHCYSSSSPQYKNELPVSKLQNIIQQLAEEGYNVIALSGGEPLLYRPLPELLEFSKSLHFFNAITTNGMLLNTDHAGKVLKHTDLIAISIDGTQEQHDEIRNLKGAFNKMLSGVQVAKNNVPNFGFIHTLFPNNWQIMPWLVEFALSNEAKLIHFHPLEITGRATGLQQNEGFDQTTLHKIYIAFNYLRQYYANEIFMQLDLLHRDNMKDNDTFVFNETDVNSFYDAQLSSLFKELIIDEKGDIIPVAHGCNKYFKIGNINDEIPVKQMMKEYITYKLADFIELYNSTYESILADESQELFNWSEILIRRSNEIYKEMVF